MEVAIEMEMKMLTRMKSPEPLSALKVVDLARAPDYGDLDKE